MTVTAFLITLVTISLVQAAPSISTLPAIEDNEIVTLEQSRERATLSGFDWGSEVVRGVNIGGWLVLEPWITPSIFNVYPVSHGIVDEYTLCKKLGNQTAHDKVLKPHWDSWAQLSHFQKIASSGFNMVRIPIGFWAFDNSGTPYASGAASYLEEAIGWARQTGLKVVIDLHGAPGSQNGFDNSGHRMVDFMWQHGRTVQRTLRILKQIQTKYGDSSYDDVIAAIELLNEPLTWDLNFNEVLQFEEDGYKQQRESSETRVVMVQDGFRDVDTYNGWLTPSDNNSQYVVMDHHEYQVFTDDLVAMTPEQHLQFVCSDVTTYYGSDKWTIVGEWSGAMTDCAVWLNGYGIGARYDGTYPNSTYVGSCSGINNITDWSEEFRNNTRAYIETQMEAFEAHSNGWLFWNFHTEGSPEWDALALIDAGIFPQPLTSRESELVCSSSS